MRLKPKSEDEWVAVTIVTVIPIILIILIMTNGPTYTGTATIIKANTWHGGDLQYYFNATISFRGQNYTKLFSCDYYHIGDKVQFQVNNLGSYIFGEPRSCIP